MKSKSFTRYDEVRKAGEYYQNRTDIQGKETDIKTRSNTKIEHPIYRRVVDQKVRYLLSRQWSVDTTDAGYGELLSDLFDSSFRRKIRRLGKHAIRDGIGWMQMYIDGSGKLTFMVLPWHEVIPLWNDSEREELDGFIRTYRQTIYVGEQKREVGHAEHWSLQGVQHYEDKEGKGEYQATTETQAHFQVGEQGYNWTNIPLVWLRYNDEELPLLRFVKELIEDYNWQTSITADALRDVAKFIYILKNYGGADLEEFVQGVRDSLAIKVNGDGGVEKLQPEVNVDGVMAFLEKQRRDVYDFASAVDTKDPQLGTASGKAIGFRYMDLDGDCTDLGAELQATFLRLKPFIDTWLEVSGQGNFEAQSYSIRFNMDLPVDETEIIGNIGSSGTLLSKRTLLANHPWVQDVDEEIEQFKQEREEMRTEFGGDLFGGHGTVT